MAAKEANTDGRRVIFWSPLKDPFLVEAQERLTWATRNLEDLRESVDRINSASQCTSFVRQEKNSFYEDGVRHIRWVRVMPTIPNDLKFEVADFAMNVRACLDMAVQEICDVYAASPPKNPQFPVMSIGSSSSSLNKLCDVLPEQFADALRALQPRFWDDSNLEYKGETVGRSSNSILADIRDVANTQKHRRTAGLVSRDVSWRVDRIPESSRRIVDSNHSVWNYDWDNSFEIATQSSNLYDARRFDPLAREGPKLQVVGIHNNGSDRGIFLDYFLKEAPKYVEGVFNTLNYAREDLLNPIDDDLLDLYVEV